MITLNLIFVIICFMLLVTYIALSWFDLGKERFPKLYNSILNNFWSTMISFSILETLTSPNVNMSNKVIFIAIGLALLAFSWWKKD